MLRALNAKINRLLKYAVLFTYSQLSLLGRNAFRDTWQIHVCDIGPSVCNQLDS